MKDLGLDGAPPMSPAVIGAAILAVIVVIAGSIFLINDGPTPEQLAASDAQTTTEYIPPPVSAFYCDSPRPRDGAPEPSSTEPNTFAVFEHVNGERVDSPLDVFAAADPAEAAYALCLTGVENGEDIECEGYGNGRTYRFEAMDWSASLYQLSTGDELVATEVRTGETPACPEIIDGRGEIIRADVDDLIYRTVTFALPQTFDERHLGNLLDANQGTWCNAASPLPQLGNGRELIPAPTTTIDGEAGAPEPDENPQVETDSQTETTLEELIEPPAEVYISGWPYARESIAAMINADSVRLDHISHVACVRAEWPIGRQWPRCDYPGHVLAWRPYDYRVTVVDIATGETLGASTFRGETSCPDVAFFESDNEIRDAVIPDAAGAFIEALLPA